MLLEYTREYLDTTGYTHFTDEKVLGATGLLLSFYSLLFI